MSFTNKGFWQHECTVATNKKSAIAAALATAFAMPYAVAIDIDAGNPDVQMRWDNSIKYSDAFRLKSQAGALTNNINLDDGDRNFNKGLISNRVDLLSEFDVSYMKAFGARISGAAWYDSVYNRKNDNNSPATVNQVSVPYNEFTAATRALHGQYAELLDAFVYANADQGNVRLGRHSIVYGETLFFGGNGIAYAQSPTDVIKLLSVPNSQFKEITIPVNQISGQYQIANNISLGGYYQFEFRPSRIPGVGSYFSGADVVGPGSERFLFAPGFGAPRAPDLDAKNSGQGGVALHWTPNGTSVEYGFYAAQYNDKVFQAYLRPLGAAVPGLPLNFQFVYPEDIRTYGASFSTEVAGFNVAGEVSVRRNTPLVSGPVLDLSPTGSAGINNNAGYAVGNSAHANLSGIFLLNKSSIWDNATLTAEVGWNRRTSVTMNPGALDPNATRDAWGLRTIFEPSYYQVLPGLDINVPIGVGYNPKGRSSVVQVFNGGVDKGGDLSIGVKGTYQQVWRFALNYVNFFGSEGPALGTDGHLTFKQSLADRDYLSFTLQRTF